MAASSRRIRSSWTAARLRSVLARRVLHSLPSIQIVGSSTWASSARVSRRVAGLDGQAFNMVFFLVFIGLILMTDNVLYYALRGKWLQAQTVHNCAVT